ncbi:arabinofuranosyltransferase [Gordonia neofelifaecis]|uniref:Galactan 5-O-arabinofuranosyltransferase n=1 Tax=Gordonia neofelifaecis NRRL B-59395 TaxID=644548 RepID=F1YMF0_9ACTN|nr:arabinofuranosyltransferase [Gordonia neofelifaecis]EGD54075.1 putative transmembrane protein [Gordonia neofelifaecis NRRL B-59395]
METTAAAAPRLSGRARDVVELGGAVVGAAVIAFAGLKIIGAVGWPAFNTSNVVRSLTTLGQAGLLLVAAIAVVWARYGRSRTLPSLLSSFVSAGLVTVTLGLPLGATKLYLFGLSVDQQFRTEYLTRLTSSPHLADMTYPDLPPYYPATWFWLGGRYAHTLGLPGWEAYKPWAILSLAVAAALGAALWNRMIGVTAGTAVSVAVTLVTLQYASPEPYSATLILVGVPMLVVIAYALRGRSRLADGPTPLKRTSWLAVFAGGVFIGLSATVYTLFTALFAGTAVLIALVYLGQSWLLPRNAAVRDDAVSAERRPRMLAVLVRLVVMGVLAGAIALVSWGPYLLERFRTDAAVSGSAEHYLPESGSIIALPMFQLSLIGLLCLIGFVWVLLRFRQRTIAMAMACALVGVVGLTLLSLALTAKGTTLLSFRLEPISTAVLAAAGALGVVALSRVAIARYGDVRLIVGVAAAAAALAVAQHIPAVLSAEITTAYTDTDGYGVRADQHAPGAESYYPKIDEAIRAQTGRPATDNVVLTADFGFLSLYPYWGFQGLTSHYANPLAEFTERATTIERWSEAQTPEQMKENLRTSPWRPPNVFLFRYSPDGYTLRLAEDVYPNDPNVKRYTVTFNPTAFDDPAFTVTEVGPFVLVVKKS